MGERTRIGVHSGKVAEPTPVAVHASQSQIFQARYPAVLPCNDVVDVERMHVGGSGKAAIFAASARAIPDGADQALIHEFLTSGGHSKPAILRASRARECITAKRFAMFT